MPEAIEIEVLEETPEKVYLVIPLNRVAFSDAVDAASGCERLGDAYGPRRTGGAGPVSSRPVRSRSPGGGNERHSP